MEVSECRKVEFIVDKLRELGLINEYYSALQHPAAAGRLCAGVTGWVWEEEVERLCAEKGLSFLPAEKKNLPYDCVINRFRTQLKASRRNEKVFDLRSHKLVLVEKKGTTDRRAYAVGELDVFVLKNLFTKAVYVVPANRVVDPRNPAHLLAYVKIKELAPFKDRWDVFTGCEGPHRPVEDVLEPDMFEELEAA